MASRSKSGEGVACLAPPSGLRKVNSETNFAVSLLLAVSGDTAGAKRAAAMNRSSANGTRQNDERSEHSAGSTEIVTDSNASRRQSESPPLAVALEHQEQEQRVVPNIAQPRSPVLSTPQLPTSPNLTRSRTSASHADGELFKYSYEERQAALRRFREKKRRRQFQKTVRYMVRKRLAETRPRYKGRFSKPPTGPAPDAEVPERNQKAGAKKNDNK